MKAPLGTLAADAFLQDYWQRRPLLIRQAFPEFQPELDIDDIAGLACEEMAESRLVSGRFPQHDWRVRYGPFRERELAALPERDWTLLVQDVEKHYPPLRALLERFAFLPRWRVDDLMVSVAAPGGSVGPHVDQYDVFLLQAQGRRRWQIAERFAPELRADCELNVLQSFEPEQEWTLGPGDMLYLPPGVAHHGVALDTGMTWSIGMRAPSAADLFQAFGEWLAEHRGEGARYTDPSRPARGDTAEVDGRAIVRFRELAAGELAADGPFTAFLGQFLSRYRLAHEPAPPENPVDEAALRAALSAGAVLRQNPWTRMLWIRFDSQVAVFAAGKRYACHEETAVRVCDPQRLAEVTEPVPEPAVFCALLNDGHLYLERGS
ncbi:MAG: cupin domain-containing protein [Xanthomonadales bacterium]